MSKALWVYMVTGEFGLPLVHTPSGLIRELRKLYAQYQVLNKQIRVYKNHIQSVLADNGIVLPKVEKNHLLSFQSIKTALYTHDNMAAYLSLCSSPDGNLQPARRHLPSSLQ